MDLKRMHYFCTIAEQGQISRAAKILHMAQPPLSQRLRELEEELGAQLLLRKGRTLELTEAGRVFYRRARDILRAVDCSMEEVIRASSLAGAAVRIGLSPTARTLWLSRFNSLRHQFPEHQIGLIMGDSSYLEHLLLTGQLDVAFMQPPVYPENFILHRLATCKTVAVAPFGLLEPAASCLSLTELSRHPLLLLRRSVGVGSYERLLRAMHEAGLTPRVALYSSDASLMLDLLDQGFPGIAVIPESETEKTRSTYSVLPIDVDLPEFQLSLVCRKADHDVALVSRLLTSWQS
ncbi:MAG TPA: LysR family transcriptional regulator [Burkholderiaceae bacterium]|nr:LysR family transcriptional regulator [Burkholderiaceae bacterium]